MVLSRSYYYLAVTPSGSLDADGRFAAAEGWPIACQPKRQGGCKPKTLADVEAQAAIQPSDPKRLYRMVRMTAAGPAGTTNIAPPPSNVPITETPLPPAAPATGTSPVPSPPVGEGGAHRAAMGGRGADEAPRGVSRRWPRPNTAV
jgi:hypothetical protein